MVQATGTQNEELTDENGHCANHQHILISISEASTLELGGQGAQHYSHPACRGP